MSKLNEEGKGARSQGGNTSLGRLYEILAVTFFAGGLFVLGLGAQAVLRGLLFVLLLAVSFAMYRLAIRSAVEATRTERALAAAEKSRAEATRYKVTDARLKILKAAGVPKDVTGALQMLKDFNPMPEAAFLSELATGSDTDLGWKRTGEFRERILTYTEFDRADNPSHVRSQPSDLKPKEYRI